MTRTNYIESHRALFWSVSDERLTSISDELLVETILNYGTLEDVRQLIQLIGLEELSRVFFKTTSGRSRHNYFPEVANYFKIYFSRHVPEYSVRTAA
ncbi:MAG: hypothetical protein ACKVT2_08775 [Saprospiraceae bacterium]